MQCLQIMVVLGKMMHGPWRFPASPRDLSVIAHASTSNYVCKSAGREAEKWCIYTVKCSSPGLKKWPSCHRDKYTGKRKPCIFFFRYNWYVPGKHVPVDSLSNRKCTPATKDQISNTDEQVIGCCCPKEETLRIIVYFIPLLTPMRKFYF